MYTYREQLVSEVLAGLGAVAPGARNFRSEIQDGGCFLLVTGDLASAMDEAEVLKVHDQIKDFLSDKLPDRYGDYSWMVVLYRGEEIACTVFSNLLVQKV